MGSVRHVTRLPCDGQTVNSSLFLCVAGDGLTLSDGTAIRVKPETGKALVFFHYLLQEGTPVTAGRKYALRTDVMYRIGISD